MSNSRHPAYSFYLYSIEVLGLAVFGYSIIRVMGGDAGYQWLIPAVLTVLTGAFTVNIPGVNSKISVADTFVFTNMMLFGPAAGTITAALDGFMASVRFKSSSRRMRATPFNMAAMALSAFVAGQVFFVLLERDPLFRGPAVGLREIFFPMVALALVYYLCNSGTVAVIAALDFRKNIYRFWRENFLFTSLTYFTGASVASLIAINFSSITPAMLVIIIPILLVTYFTNKTHLDKIEEHVHHLQNLNSLYLRTVESLALAVDAKDQTTYGHIRRVRAYALGLAKLCDIKDSNELLAVETGSLLHDIGKLAVDDYILNKPGRLNAQEFEKMKAHAAAGGEILEQIQCSFPAAKYVRAHHERWDGKGYPDGLKGEEIPLGARLLSISDAFDAMRSSRPYKLSLDLEDSIQLLRSQAGTFYDPNLVDLFVTHLDELEASAVEATKTMPHLALRRRTEDSGSDGISRTPPPIVTCVTYSVTEELISFCEFCSSLGRQLKLSDLLVNLHLHLQRLVPFNTCIIFLSDEDDTLRARHATGKYSEVLRNHRIPYGKGISGWVAAFQRPIFNTAPALDFQGLTGNFTSLADSLVVPLISDGISIGTISLYAEPPIFFTEAQLALLETIAGDVALLIVEACSRERGAPAQCVLDSVTGTYRSGYLSVAGPQMIDSAKKSRSHFSLVYLKIRAFAEFIEMHPWTKGDAMLRRIAEVFRDELRESDVLVRFGADGFMMLLPGVIRDGAVRRAGRLQQKVRETPVPDGTETAFLECATSVASYPDDGSTIFDLVWSARKLLGNSMPETDAKELQTEDKVIEFQPRPRQ